MTVTSTALTPTTRPGLLQSARFYITFRCNSLCGYCNVWQDDKFKGYEELTLKKACQILDEMYALGVRYVDFTGGEPVLHPHIDGIVQYAKSLGMTVEITSNGIRFAKHIDAIVPYVDTMNVSLDTLRPDRYQKIRGVPTLDRALDVIRRIAATGADNLKLICVVTRENRDEVPDLLRFAHDNRITIYFSGMFEYFDEQDTVRDVNRTARKLKLIEQNGKPLADTPATRARRLDESEPTGDLISAELMRLLYQPFALLNLHFRKFMETLDPTAPTDCYANKRILTVGPDGRLVLPCYHAFDNSVVWDRSLTEMVQDEEFLRVRDEEVGHRSECRSCTVFPYIGLSFSYRFDKIFLYQAVSEEIAKIKTRFTNHLYPRITPDFDALHRRYAGLERFLDRELPTPRPPLSSDHFYRFDVSPLGVRTDLVTGEISLAELLSDHTHEHCWGIQRSPHLWMRLVYNDLVPALRAMADAGRLAPSDYEALVGDLHEVHLAWWQAYMGRYFNGGEALDTAEPTAVVSRFLERTAGLLPDAPEASRVRQVLLHAGCVLGLDPRVLGSLATRLPFPEAALTVKHLLLLAPDADLLRYADLLPAEAAEPLRRVSQIPPSRGGSAPAGQEDAEVIRLLRHEDDLDQGTAHELVESLRVTTSEQRRKELRGLVIAHELRTPHLVRRRGEEIRLREQRRSASPHG
ncbi:radical SAM protein [Streptomyces sp. NPDC058092]|uniref:radical SAM protein n=1 Tax=Streptomyces sp. NPDC058092 TaxID=3346336 RepID=UPI0036EE0E05